MVKCFYFWDSVITDFDSWLALFDTQKNYFKVMLFLIPLFPRKSWIANDFELLLRRMKDSLKELVSKVRTTLQIGWRKVNNWTVFYGRLNWWPYKDSNSASLHVLLSKVGAWKVNSFIRNKYYIYQHTINPIQRKLGAPYVFTSPSNENVYQPLWRTSVPSRDLLKVYFISD